VIHNLVINAEHAMPNGGEVIISAQNTVVNKNEHLLLNEGLYVKIAVKDYGIGIQHEHLGKIFDPYFTTKQRGSGLGLATSYSIIQKHQGYITVQSEPGEGTTVYLYLPASEEDIINSNYLTNNTVDGKGRILIMDDEKSIRFMLVEILNLLGYEPACAQDGEEAIKLYTEAEEAGAPFDAVLMDLTIHGGMGGQEAIQKLLEIDPGVKAIVSSGYSNDPVMANRFLQNGRM